MFCETGQVRRDNAAVIRGNFQGFVLSGSDEESIFSNI